MTVSSRQPTLVSLFEQVAALTYLARRPEMEDPALWTDLARAMTDLSNNRKTSQPSRHAYPASPTQAFLDARWIVRPERKADLDAARLVALRRDAGSARFEKERAVADAMTRPFLRNTLSGASLPDLDQLALVFHLGRIGAPTRTMVAMFDDTLKTGVISEVRALTGSIQTYARDTKRAGADWFTQMPALPAP